MPARGRARDPAGMKPKEHRFPVEAVWESGRVVRVHVEGKDDVAVTSPPAFNPDADPSVWSPEDLFGSAAAACLAVTITGIARREELPLRELTVGAVGVVGRRDDGRFGFVRLEQEVEIATDPGHEEQARTLVEKAEATCLVASSLDVEIATEIRVSALGGVAGTRLSHA
jgi:organic hydroperoxide reductase OsmC/OhrA